MQPLHGKLSENGTSRLALPDYSYLARVASRRLGSIRWQSLADAPEHLSWLASRHTARGWTAKLRTGWTVASSHLPYAAAVLVVVIDFNAWQSLSQCRRKGISLRNPKAWRSLGQSKCKPHEMDVVVAQDNTRRMYYKGSRRAIC